MRDYLRLAPFLVFGLGWIWTTQYDPFFWDTIQLGSKHAHFFYENHLHFAPLPVNIDSGHPPFLGYYLAICWSVFGKTLPVSHWAMAPFLLGTIVLLYRLGRHLGGSTWAFWLIPLVWIDPVMAGQSTLVGPDLILACWFLLTLTGIFEKRGTLVMVGIAGLCTVSMRGMMTAGALFVFELITTFRRTDSISGSAKQLWWKYLPGGLLGGGFLLWHYLETGWMGYHTGSSWAAAFAPVNAKGFIRNILVVGFRWLDFGRVAEWLLLLRLAWYYFKKKNEGPSMEWLLLGAILVVFLTPTALLYNNLSATRYFIPIFLWLHLFFFQWMMSRTSQLPILKSLVITLLIGFFALNNCLAGPWSMDWDCTLAHQPYHEARKEALTWLNNQDINFSTVGTAFPNLNTSENIDLNGDSREFAEIDFKKNDYILVSNVFNDFKPLDYRLLYQYQFSPVEKFDSGPVRMVLYQRKK
jgi:hypothetical protein